MQPACMTGPMCGDLLAEVCIIMVQNHHTIVHFYLGEVIPLVVLQIVIRLQVRGDFEQ